MQRRNWMALLGIAGAVSLGGCTAIQTPDGHQLRVGNRIAEVDHVLGPPDLIEEGVTWNDNPREERFYMSSGYSLWFRNGRLNSIKKIEAADRPDLERRIRVTKEVVPLVRVGASAPDLIYAIGAPDAVEDVRVEKGMDQTYRGRYDKQMDRQPPPERLLCYYFGRDIVVVMESGRVTKAKPMAAADAVRMRQWVSEQRESNGEAGEK
jgi:hypothetical protein